MEDHGQKRTGRPRDGEIREKLRQIGFKGDAETREAIERLTEALPAYVLGRRSVAIREALKAAAKALPLKAAEKQVHKKG